MVYRIVNKRLSSKKKSTLNLLTRTNLFFLQQREILFLFIVVVLIGGFISYFFIPKISYTPTNNYNINLNINGISQEDSIKILESLNELIKNESNIDEYTLKNKNDQVKLSVKLLESSRRDKADSVEDKLLESLHDLGKYKIVSSISNNPDIYFDHYDVALNLINVAKTEDISELQLLALRLGEEIRSVKNVKDSGVVLLTNIDEEGVEAAKSGYNHMTVSIADSIQVYPSILIGVKSYEGADQSTLQKNIRSKINSSLTDEELNQFKYFFTDESSKTLESDLNNFNKLLLFGVILSSFFAFLFIGFRSFLTIIIVIFLSFLSFLIVGLFTTTYLNPTIYLSFLLAVPITLISLLLILDTVVVLKPRIKNYEDTLKKSLETTFKPIVVIVMTSITLIPFTFLNGYLSRMFNDFSLNLLLFSLFGTLLSSTFALVFYKIFSVKISNNKTPFKKISNFFSSKVDRFVHKFSRITLNIKDSKKITFTLSAIFSLVLFICISSLFFIPKVSYTLLPEKYSDDSINILIRFDDNVNIQEASKKSLEIEEILYSLHASDIERTYFTNADIFNAELRVVFKDTYSRGDLQSLLEEVNEKLLNVDGLEARAFSKSIVDIKSLSSFKVDIFYDNESYKNASRLADAVSLFLKGKKFNNASVESSNIYYKDVKAIKNGRNYIEVEAILNNNSPHNLFILQNNLLDEFNEEELRNYNLNSDNIDVNFETSDDLIITILRAIVGFIVIIIVLYMIYGGLYRSSKLALLSLSTLLLSIPGIILGLLIFDYKFDARVLLGILYLVLFILAVQSIFMIHFIKRLIKGYTPVEAASLAVRSRSKVIILSFICGMAVLLPFLFSYTVLHPIIVTVVFGMLSTMIFSPLVLPLSAIILTSGEN